ncbi:unnamed protein product [Heterosigma akashiwo]|uniref:Uncharacterized protein n=1 Tax=Heterosigma akashiwo TaxID=2829 RepID=A0A6V1QH88_HETAK|mmetsp:Transcript_22031/g.35318  ORF Transcript_22031/g.35318 Transcript_22031/m.35318 type:complete len:308 (-) Transcript_22031:535-1458(-)
MVDKQVIFDTSENIGSQKSNGAPPTRSVSSNRLPTKPVDISFPEGNDLRKSVSEIFSSHNSSQHPGYSQSLPTFTSFKVLTPRAPLFKSRPTPNEDLIPPLSLPPSNNFFEENSVSRRSQSVQLASSCPASIWHFEDRRNRAQPAQRSLAGGGGGCCFSPAFGPVPEALRPEDEQPTPGSPPEGLFWSPPRKGSLTALQLLELGGGGGPERAPEDAVRDRFPSLGQLDDLLPPPPPDPFGAPAADGDEEGAGAGAAHAHDPRYRYPSIEDPFVLDPVEEADVGQELEEPYMEENRGHYGAMPELSLA